MKLLLIKTSSLGDVIHTLPAVSDAVQAQPALEVDWLVEEGIAQVPAWHPAVRRVLPVALRRWRRSLGAGTLSEIRTSVAALRRTRYDLIIDAQGLFKSALLTRLARGRRCGYDWSSARESGAALAYGTRIASDPGTHAVDRLRDLFAACLAYPRPRTAEDYGIDPTRLPVSEAAAGDRYLVFIHGTTWSSKLWPEPYWQELARQAGAAGYRVLLPWGNPTEHHRAQALAQAGAHVQLLPPLQLVELAGVLRGAAGAVAVDSGLGHLAAALELPCVSLYGATDPRLTGTRGIAQRHLRVEFDCAPCLARRCRLTAVSDVQPACFTTVSPRQVWDTLATVLRERDEGRR